MGDHLLRGNVRWALLRDQFQSSKQRTKAERKHDQGNEGICLGNTMRTLGVWFRGSQTFSASEVSFMV